MRINTHPDVAALIGQLVARRRLLRLSQDALAEEMGTHRQTLTLLESKVSAPYLGTICRYAETMGLRVTFEPRSALTRRATQA